LFDGFDAILMQNKHPVASVLKRKSGVEINSTEGDAEKKKENEDAAARLTAEYESLAPSKLPRSATAADKAAASSRRFALTQELKEPRQ
jgi:hypothetical protein